MSINLSIYNQKRLSKNLPSVQNWQLLEDSEHVKMLCPHWLCNLVVVVVGKEKGEIPAIDAATIWPTCSSIKHSSETVTKLEYNHHGKMDGIFEEKHDNCVEKFTF